MYDYIVIGAGSAGCVVASASRKILIPPSCCSKLVGPMTARPSTSRLPFHNYSKPTVIGAIPLNPSHTSSIVASAGPGAKCWAAAVPIMP